MRPNQGILKASETMQVTISLKGKVPEGVKPHRFSVQTALTNLDPSDMQGQLDLWKNAAVVKNQTVLTVVFAGQDSGKEEGKADSSKEDPMLVSIMPNEEVKAEILKQSVYQTAVGGIPPAVAQPQLETPQVTASPQGGKVKEKAGWTMSHVALLVVAVIVALKVTMMVFGE